MVEKIPSHAVKSLSTQWEAETKEILLSELIETDDTRSIFEELVGDDTGIGRMPGRLRPPQNFGVGVTGGDPDDDWYQAEVVGEEAVGGQNPTPDQNVTEELLYSMGIISTDGDPVQTMQHFQKRDLKRWELDPESSEDYQEHWE